MRRSIIATAVFSTLVCATASGQRTWKEIDTGRSIGLDLIRGFYKAPAPDFLSFTATLVGRVPASQKLVVTGAIPYARISQSSEFAPTRTQTAFGDPMIGLEYASAPDLTLEVQFRPGIASERNASDALALGFGSDFDHFEAWLPKISTLRIVAHSGVIPARGGFASGLFGGMVTVPSDGTADVFANYGFRVGYREPGVMGTLALTGRIAISGGGTLDERMINQLALTIEGTGGKLIPYASLRNFLDPSIRDGVDIIVALGARAVF